jgi:hypothetical protein
MRAIARPTATSSCASCHIFGDFDSLAWDLGNPDAPVTPHPGPFLGPRINLFTHQPMPPEFHPMKGPTTTQSLRGMLNAGPMHWRGDRTAGNDEPTVQPDGGSFNEFANFKKFQVGFTDLLGRSEFIADADMHTFTDFILQVTYPPNPIRALDNGLTADQAAGRGHFFNVIRDGTNVCNGCHVLDPQANPASQHPGFFGTAGSSTFDFQPQLIKTPHLRNLYQKIGMFGMAAPPFGILPGDNNHKGDQVRGFGFLHDGSFDTVFRFMRGMGFSPFVGITIPEGTFPDNPDGIEDNMAGDLIRRNIESFLLAFDSNMKPIVGQQVTLSAATATAAAPRIALLMSRADAGDCELVAKGTTLAGHSVGFLYVGHGTFQSDRQAVPSRCPRGLCACWAFCRSTRSPTRVYRSARGVASVPTGTKTASSMAMKQTQAATRPTRTTLPSGVTTEAVHVVDDARSIWCRRVVTQPRSLPYSRGAIAHSDAELQMGDDVTQLKTVDGAYAGVEGKTIRRAANQQRLCVLIGRRRGGRQHLRDRVSSMGVQAADVFRPFGFEEHQTAGTGPDKIDLVILLVAIEKECCLWLVQLLIFP